ncbi:MAG: ABC transporter substrate-binding protein [Candidatus Heimdallarchaeota archaeon]|nr:ABC transporter substrate-binding protein [Candidatus Heimdallarchaeota archaeon]
MKIKNITLIVILITSLTVGPFLSVSAETNPLTPPTSTLDDTVLTVVTRHDTTIQAAFKTAFLATPRAVELGITDMVFLQATTDEGWKKLLEDPAKGVDLAWGGGPSLFNTMNNWGLLKAIDNTTLNDYINTNVPDEIAEASMKLNNTSGELIWIANAISSFGFTVNHDFLDQYGLPVPYTWEELASPAYYINPSVKAISLGDPPLTTSNTRIYQIILQAFGWEVGWSLMTRMGGNSGIYPGSVDTRAAVVSGEVGIAMTIDFYGVIAARENPSCEYIIPDGQSIVNGDPIALGINVDAQEGAEAFLEYLFSAEGQSVWLTEGLDRLPVVVEAFATPFGLIKPALYTLYNLTLANEGIDFNETEATDLLDVTIYYFHNTIASPHSLLRQTWGEMVTQLRNGDINESYFSELVEDLGAVNMTYEDAFTINEEFISDPLDAAKYESQWRNFAGIKYNAIYQALVPSENPLPTLPVIISIAFLAAVPIICKKRKN